MKMIKEGDLEKGKGQLFRGTCRKCEAEFEARSDELNVIHYPREGPFAKHDCDYCSAEDSVYFYQV